MASVLAVTIAGFAAFLRITYAPFYYAKVGLVKGFWITLLPLRVPIWLVVSMASAAFAFDVSTLPLTFLRGVLVIHMGPTWGSISLSIIQSPSSYLVTALFIGAVTGLTIYGVMTAFSAMVEQLTSNDSSHTTSIRFGNGLSAPHASDNDYDAHKKPFDKPSWRTIRPESR